MSLDDGVSELINDIYDCAQDSTLWDRAFRGLQTRTGSRLVMVAATDLRSRELTSNYFQGPDDARVLDSLSEYEAELYRDDPCLQFAARHPNAGLVTLPIACADLGVDYSEHPFWHWTSNTIGAGLNLIRYTPALDGLTFSIAILPDAARVAHNAAEQRLFFMLFEHFERAMRMAARPVDFESGDEARLLLDSRGRVRAVSEAARLLLEANDGLAIVSGKLVAGRPDDDAKLDRLLCSALSFRTLGTAGGVALIQRPSRRRAWVLTASPLPRPPKPFEAFRPAVVLHIIDPDAAPSAQEQRLWATAFGLTPTEIRLVEALLVDDHGLRSAADGLGMAYATARVHLAHVFEKTGVRSQLQLAKLLSRIHS